MTITSTVRVTIGVPTYLRPRDLDALLPMLLDQMKQVEAEFPGEFAMRVLVIDNDASASAKTSVEAFQNPRIQYVCEPMPGISAARNRAMAESVDSTLLAMIDDDERPHARWLAALLSTWCASRPSLVAGRVVAEFEGALDPWIEAGEFFTRRNLRTGDEIAVSAAGNVLLDLSQIRPLELWFESKFGLSGGEDTFFSRQLHAKHKRMVWCAESLVSDVVPAARMTRRWVLRRSWSHGNTSSLIDVELASNPVAILAVRIRNTLGGLVRVGLGVVRYVAGLCLRSHRHQARGLRLLLRGLGMVSGAWGMMYQEYARGSSHSTGGGT